MSVRNRSLAALVILPSLAGHCLAQSRKSAPSTSANPSMGLIGALRPKLEKAVARINRLSVPLGLAGWPGLRGSEATDLPNASLEDRVFRNNRVLILHGQSTDAYAALVLMREVPAGPEVYYHLVMVQDMFGEATVRKMPSETARTYVDSECLWFEGDNVHTGDPEDLLRWPKPGLRVLPDSTVKFALAAQGTDNFGCLIYSPGKQISPLIDDLLDAHDVPENNPDQGGEDSGNYIKRSDFNHAKKTAEDDQFIWFQVADEAYAAEKKDWALWMKGPHPVVPKNTNP